MNRAKLQVVKIFDTLLDDTCIWKVVGSFVKKLVCPDHYDNNLYLDFIIVSTSETFTKSKVLKLCDSLQILGLCDEHKYTDNMFHLDIKIPGNIGGLFTTVPVRIYDKHYESVTVSENLILTKHGLSLLKMDRREAPGIAIATRLMDMSEHKETVLWNYYNMPDSDFIRKKNASVLLKHLAALQGGFAVNGPCGSSLDIYKADCSICYEENSYCARIQCGHDFCMACLAYQIEQPGNNYGSCALCRSPIMFNLE